MASDKKRKWKDNSTLFENNSGQMPIEVPIKDVTSPILLVNEVINVNGGTSSMEGDQDQY